MKCPKCQIENDLDANFCEKCGVKLEVACPECGNTVRPDSKFCKHCGHSLTIPSELTPKDLSLDEKLEKIQKYLPKGITEKILAQRDRIEGERKQVTVMFCDMEGLSCDRNAYTSYCPAVRCYHILDMPLPISRHTSHKS